MICLKTDSEDLSSKFLLYSHIYLPSVPFTEGRVRLAILYQAKTYRKTLASEMKARDAINLKLFDTNGHETSPKTFLKKLEGFIYVGWML